MTDAGTPSTDAPGESGEQAPEDPRRTLLVGAVLVVSLGAIIRGIEGWLGNPMQASVLGAVVVSFVMGRTGVPSARGGARAWRRAVVSAGAVFVVLALATGGAVVAGAHVSPSRPTGALFFGTLESLALAFRDEVWLHGIPLAVARRAGIDLRYAGVFAVLASVAAVALEPSTTVVGLALTATSSAVFVALWLRGRDAWAPIGAHFAFAWGADALLGGELFSVQRAAGLLTHGASSTGLLAIGATLGFALLAIGVPRLPIPAAIAEEMEDPDG